MKKIILPLMMLFFIPLPGVGGAAPSKGQSEIGFMGGGIFFEGDLDLDEDWVYGVRIAHYVTQNIALQASVLGGETEIRGVPNNDADILIPMLEGVYHFGASAWRPYVSLGVGALQVNRDRRVRDNDVDFAAQAGIGLKMAIRPYWGAFLEARHLIDVDSGEGTHNGIGLTGVYFLFGEADTAPVARTRRRPKPIAQPVPTPEWHDSDSDGVEDHTDACGGTPVGIQVDESGCPVDSDSDGVTDEKDNCPGTPQGMKVDSQGCIVEVEAVPEKEWVLEGVNFEVKSEKLTSESFEVLDKAANILITHPAVTVEVQGYTDSYGKPAYNLMLSQKRAWAVYSYLVKRGVPADRLTAKGYGEKNPLANNKTAEGRAKNRRIEFKVLSR